MAIDLRTSERTAMKRCPQKWYWAYVEGLVPMRAANALWFGAAIHEALAGWYLPGMERGERPAEAFLVALEGDRSFLVTNEDEEKEYEDARTLGYDMLDHYVEVHGIDEHMDFISTEQTFQVWVPSLDGKRKRFTRYVGTWDGVYRDLVTGEVWLIEHKTTAGLQITHLALDDQGGSYWAVANSKLRKMGVLKPSEEIAGIMYNFLRKSMRDTRPVNEQGLRTNKPIKQHYVSALREAGYQGSDIDKAKIEYLESLTAARGIEVLGDVSKTQPAPHFERWPVYRSRAERRTMIRRIQEESVYADAWRRGALPLYKTPVPVGPQACQHSCQFFRLCQLHEQGDEGWEEFRDTMFEQADPYADHPRKSTDQ